MMERDSRGSVRRGFVELFKSYKSPWIVFGNRGLEIEIWIFHEKKFLRTQKISYPLFLGFFLRSYEALPW